MDAEYGVFYARFQPFTRGHLDACLQILKQHEQLVVGISNPFRRQFEFSPLVSEEAKKLKLSSLSAENNPFTFWQRLQMVRDSLSGAGADMRRVWVVAKPPTFAANSAWHDAFPSRDKCVIYLPFAYAHHFENARIHQAERWRLVDISQVADYSGSESLAALRESRWKDAEKLMPREALRVAREALHPSAEVTKPAAKASKYGIFHGRFQPFHNAALEHCRAILKKHDYLVLGIANPFRDNIRFSGDVTESGRESKMVSLAPENNPFSFWERYRMARNALLADGVKPKRFFVVAKPSSLGESREWEEVFPPREESDLYFPVKDPHHLDGVAIYRKLGWRVVLSAPIEGYSGTAVRALIRERNWPAVGKLVPPATLKVVKEVAQAGGI